MQSFFIMSPFKNLGHFRINVFTTIVHGSVTNNIFDSDFSSYDNRPHNRLKGINFIHTSAVQFSDVNELNLRINLNSSIENERLSNLQVVPYKDKGENLNKELSESGISSISDCFPWLIDKKGSMIDLNKDINLFEGVQLISNYLEQKYKMEPNLISEAKISELLELFNKDKDTNKVTVLDLFKHVSEIYNKDNDSFKTTIVNKIFSDSQLVDLTNKQNRPLGRFGDITINDLVTKISDYKWELILNEKTSLTVNTLPLIVNSIGYGLVLRSYYKYVYNIPYRNGLTEQERTLEDLTRNRRLGIFAIVGALLVVYFLSTSIRLKDMGSVQFPLGSSTENSTNNGLFLFLSSKIKKIPNWLKLIFSLLLVIILVLKLLGLSSLDVLNNPYYIKIFSYISCSLAIFYELLNLYLLHKFTNKNIKISEVLPEFIINWLQEFEV